MAKTPKILAQREIPKEQLQELSLVGLKLEIPKKESSITETLNQTIIHEHSLEQLIELQRVGVLSIYPRKRE